MAIGNIYSPVINNFPSGCIEVLSVGSLTYKELELSLGSNVYNALGMYFRANTNSQISKQLLFKGYDVNGEVSIYSVVPTISPYQFQSALNIDLEEKNVIFDGQLTFDVDLNPGETIDFIFSITKLSAAAMLHDNDSIFDFFKEFGEL